MKEIINYYYNLDLNDVFECSTYTSFTYQGEEYFFVFFNRTNEELKN